MMAKCNACSETVKRALNCSNCYKTFCIECFNDEYTHLCLGDESSEELDIISTSIIKAPVKNVTLPQRLSFASTPKASFKLVKFKCN